MKAVAVIVSCDLTTKEANRIINTCYNQQQLYSVDSAEYYELVKLAILARDIRPGFTAAGFFSVNRVLLFSILSVVITYFIIILQFNKQ